jgi:amino acid transporter
VSLAIATTLYAVLHALCVIALPELGRSTMPLVDAGRAYGGNLGGSVVAAGATLSALGIAFAMFNTTPRYLAALAGTDGLGDAIGRRDERQVPQRALWITAVGVTILVAFSERLSQLLVLSSLAVLAQYAVALGSLGVLALRRQERLSLHHFWPVPLSVVGLVLAARGAVR